MSLRSMSRLVPLALFLAAAAPAKAASPNADPAASGATALETRLLAPCCFTQTLDYHESELSTALRAEIRQRLRAGETTGAIEEDFVARYGERVRAVPKDVDTRSAIPVISAVASLLGAAGLFVWMRRRTQRASSPVAGAPSARDEYDEHLDDELRRLDA